MEKIKYFYETKDYRVIKTDDIRKKIRFIYFPIFRNKKVYWLQYVETTERKYICQTSQFNDGWGCNYSWKKPYDDWELEEIKKL